MQLLYLSSLVSPTETTPSSPEYLPCLSTTAIILEPTPPITTVRSPVSPSPVLSVHFEVPLASLDRVGSTPADHEDTVFQYPGRPNDRHELKSLSSYATTPRLRPVSSDGRTTSSYYSGLPIYYDDSFLYRGTDDDMPPGYPYKTYTDVLRFVWEYVMSMQSLTMQWLEKGVTKGNS